MKLFYNPGACSMASHIALREAGIDPTLEKVDLADHKTAGGQDFFEVNPKGYVPALMLDDGTILTEGAAIMQYVADQNPNVGIAPPSGTVARARLQEHLNYIASELHKSFSPLFNPTAHESVKQAAPANIGKRLDYLEGLFADGRPFLLGDDFSIADGYLFTVLGWTKFVGIDLAMWPLLTALYARVASRPAVQAAMRAEGLI